MRARPRRPPTYGRGFRGDGTASGATCLDWSSTSSAKLNGTGSTTNVDEWTNQNDGSRGLCDRMNALYCFEQ